MTQIFKIIALFFVYLLLGLPAVDAAISTGNTKLALFIRDDFEQMSQDAFESIESGYLEELQRFRDKKKLYRSDESFLKFFFYRVHRKYLKNYEQQVLFSEIFKESGKYDCVTGTALLSLFLDDLGYQYDIIETDYHVYLMTKACGKEYLMEATDPLNGFSSNTKEIEERRQIVMDDAKRINEELAMTGISSDFGQFQDHKVTVINNTVSLKELAGLHYYNQSLRAFNNENYRKAYKFISVAQGIYPSKRMKNAGSFIFSVAFSN